jgi:hypothetical protein
MALRVNVVCRNLNDDRVIPRFSRYLQQRLGWTLTAVPDPHAEVVYLSGYFESQKCRAWPSAPVMAYFTHREEQPPGNDKAQLFDTIAGRVQLRIATAAMYAGYLERYGPTVQIRPPVERDRFVPPPPLNPPQRGGRGRVAGFSGYTYRNKRKGEDLVRGILASKPGQGLEWRASGRGWPVATKRYNWRDMPGFYQSLDVLVVTSRVEGVPMPPLEAMACGVSVVVPRGVGLLDELPNVPGIHRYKRGDLTDLVKAVGKAVRDRGDVDREALRAATEPYTIEAWCEGHLEAVLEMMDGPTAGLAEDDEVAVMPVEIKDVPEQRTESATLEKSPEISRGIYCVAFGDPARTCALKMMRTAKAHMPEIPICLCSDRAIGPEDVLVVQPDSDVGGRRAKLKAYELTPAEWGAVLYLDADTEVVGDIRFYFKLIEDGWEFVICKDPHLMDTMHAFRRKGNLAELEETAAKIHTMHTLQYNGGVWAFGRNKRIARFFARWQAEWERHAQRDQGALIRAMYSEPLRVYLLGNEWNTFPKYTKGIKTAGLMHYPGRARRWRGQIPGRIDSPTAWGMVRRHERQRRGKR